MDPFSHAGGSDTLRDGKAEAPSKKSTVPARTCDMKDSNLRALESAMQLKRDIMTAGSNCTSSLSRS